MRNRFLLVVLFACACSPRRIAVNAIADALSGGGDVFASDDDPELIRDAVPFALKTMESLAQEEPKHVGLLTALCKGFTQYGYAFVQAEADAAELDGKVSVSRPLRARAGRLYKRGVRYGLRALDARHPGLVDTFKDMHTEDLVETALEPATKEDVPILYWTAIAWFAQIAADKTDMRAVGSLQVAEALMHRALTLDEAWDEGAIHAFYVTYDPGRPEVQGGGLKKAKEHLSRALDLSHNKVLSPLVSYAEAVSVQSQDKAEFKKLLEKVLALDVDADPPHRLANTLAQRRARLLLSHQDDLFAN
jgi:predicted anti-sigma-YlaC factor YlaD